MFYYLIIFITVYSRCSNIIESAVQLMISDDDGSRGRAAFVVSRRARPSDGKTRWTVYNIIQ